MYIKVPQSNILTKQILLSNWEGEGMTPFDLPNIENCFNYLINS